VAVKKILAEEIGRWMHRDAESLKAERTKEICLQLELGIHTENEEVDLTDGESSDSE
jgi:hypothetical protein